MADSEPGGEIARSELRASHDDRDRVVELLRVSAGDGRLTAEELDQRLELALTARTYGELAKLVTDLPAAGSGGGAAARGAEGRPARPGRRAGGGGRAAPAPAAGADRGPARPAGRDGDG